MLLAPSRSCGVAALLAAFSLNAGCGSEPGELQSLDADRQELSCGAGCGGPLGSATLPGPTGSVTLTAWSNSPQLGTVYDCDPTACAGNSPVTARNGQLSYGCPWQCVELVNRYFQGTWGDPKIAADAGAGFCQRAASSSLPQYWVYGAYGASTSGHAPIAGDVLVWSSHVAIATNSMSPGAAGTISVIAQNATCSGTDLVGWNGSMFGPKYGLGALCWVHIVANTGATGPICPTGSNWNLAGDYCGDEPGMQHAAANTLYSCAAAGGAASVVQVCSQGCQHMPAGQNDRCASPPPPPPPPPPDAGSGPDGGAAGAPDGGDAGTPDGGDAGTPDGGAAVTLDGSDAGTSGDGFGDPPPGCASGGGGIAWSGAALAAWLALSRRRRPSDRRRSTPSGR